jgi:polysaccharide biosynthesis/export protein
MLNAAKFPCAPALALFTCLAISLFAGGAGAQSMHEVLGPGDTVRITAYRHPDMTTEARLSDEGRVSVPMIGQVTLRGMTPEQAANHIAERLAKGNFILHPQIDVSVQQARSRQVSVLGFVTTPGRYMLEGSTAKVTDVIAMAGGLQPTGADTAVVSRTRDGKTEALNVDLAAIVHGDVAKDIEVGSGDSVFVPKAPVVYVSGEVQKGGSYRLEPGMTVMQAISVAGGITPRGSERRVQLRRRDAAGAWKETSAKLTEPVSPDDVIHVRESLF